LYGNIEEHFHLKKAWDQKKGNLCPKGEEKEENLFHPKFNLIEVRWMWLQIDNRTFRN
jgi:hypothetical protein